MFCRFALPALILLAPLAAGAEELGAAASPVEWQTNFKSAGNRPSSPSFGENMREGPTGGIWQRNQALGNLFGVRSALSQFGISFSASETSEYLGNLSGGTRQNFVYDGLTTLDLRVDSHRALGYRYGEFNVSALDVHGMNLSQRNLNTLQTASGIEADDGFRLWELWYQQGFAEEQVDLRLGQQSLDQEFMVSQNALLFVNTMFGWPMLTSVDLLGGGPAYPLSSLGARLHVAPMGSPWNFLFGVFDDNPSGITPGASSDPQRLNASGTNFRLKDHPLYILEMQYSRPANGEMQEAGENAILPGTYKLGAWFDNGKFPDQHYTSDGISIADTNNSNGVTSLVQNNFSIYAVADQLVWRENEESPRGLSFFLRAMGAPARQNQVSFSANVGFTLRAPFFHRDYDALGLGFGLARVSPRLRALDQDTNFFGNSALPERTTETFLELTYQYQFVPWWQFQPEVQYVMNPGGGVADPALTPARLKNELVVGLRTNITL